MSQDGEWPMTGNSGERPSPGRAWIGQTLTLCHPPLLGLPTG